MLRNALENVNMQIIPPQVSMMLALRYVYELGIPPQMIPTSITLELDPSSPLPPPNYIFSQTVTRLITSIKQNLLNSEKDIDECDEGLFEQNQINLHIEDNDNPFEFEEDIIHSIQTIPIIPTSRPDTLRRPLVPRDMFNIMRFNILNLPPLSQEDLDQFFVFDF